MNSVLVGMFDSQASATQARTHLLAAGFDAESVSMPTGSVGQGDGDDAGGSRSDPEQEGAISRFFHSMFGSDDKDDTGYGDTYNEAFRRGHYGVTVKAASDDELDRAEGILNDAGAIDIDEQSQQWRNDGWSGGASAMAGTSGMGGMDSATMISGSGSGSGSGETVAQRLQHRRPDVAGHRDALASAGRV